MKRNISIVIYLLILMCFFGCARKPITSHNVYNPDEFEQIKSIIVFAGEKTAYDNLCLHSFIKAFILKFRAHLKVSSLRDVLVFGDSLYLNISKTDNIINVPEFIEQKLKADAICVVWINSCGAEKDQDVDISFFSTKTCKKIASAHATCYASSSMARGINIVVNELVDKIFDAN